MFSYLKTVVMKYLYFLTVWYFVNFLKQLNFTSSTFISTCIDFLFTFYRATPCVSAVFAVVRCPSVCLSVCLSITFVYCIQTAEDIVRLLPQLQQPVNHSSFLIPSSDTQFPGNPFRVGTNYKGMEKN